MKPSPFRYVRPASLDEALAFLEEHGSDCALLAGGQSLVPMMNFRLARPEVLVDLNGLDELRGIRNGAGGVEIGAMTRQCEIERSQALRAAAPLLVEATPLIGHFQIRNRGTIGGSVAHADPAAEYPAVLAGLGGSVVLTRRGTSREVRAGEFFRGPFITAIEPGELCTAIRMPASGGERHGVAFLEIARRHGDFAVAGAAAAVWIAPDGAIRDARLALAGVAPTPLAVDVLEWLRGRRFDEAPLDELAESARRVAEPRGDVHGTADYRRHVAGTLAVRALRLAVRRALGEEAS
jgi:aerobic carbon-monoxide dehydrogenase medium subunit